MLPSEVVEVFPLIVYTQLSSSFLNVIIKTLFLGVQNFVLTNPVCFLSAFEITLWQQDTQSLFVHPQ